MTILLLVCAGCAGSSTQPKSNEALKPGVVTEIEGQQVLLRKIADQHCGAPVNGFTIYLNPKQERGQADFKIAYEVEPPNSCQKTTSKELTLSFAPDVKDVDSSIMFERRYLSDGKISPQGTDQSFCSYYDDSNLGRAISCLNQPNNRYENVTLMDLVERAYEQLKATDSIKMELIRDLISGGKTKTEYWKPENQSARELQYRKSHPEYKPFNSDSVLGGWSAGELNNPVFDPPRPKNFTPGRNVDRPSSDDILPVSNIAPLGAMIVDFDKGSSSFPLIDLFLEGGGHVTPERWDNGLRPVKLPA